jgi:hypothetical protein
VDADYNKSQLMNIIQSGPIIKIPLILIIKISV